MHNGGADLDAGRAEAMNSAASRQLAMPPMPEWAGRLRVGGAALDHVQRDGLHRRAAVATMRAQAANFRFRDQEVEVNLSDAVERINQ